MPSPTAPGLALLARPVPASQRPDTQFSGVKFRRLKNNKTKRLTARPLTRALLVIYQSSGGEHGRAIVSHFPSTGLLATHFFSFFFRLGIMYAILLNPLIVGWCGCPCYARTTRVPATFLFWVIIELCLVGKRNFYFNKIQKTCLNI